MGVSIMAESDRTSIDEALARFLDGETEPGDGELLAEAMRAEGRFADEVRRLLMIDDLLRQDALQDDRAFQMLRQGLCRIVGIHSAEHQIPGNFLGYSGRLERASRSSRRRRLQAVGNNDADPPVRS
jgi:hypothetical protein